jgi:integrase
MKKAGRKQEEDKDAEMEVNDLEITEKGIEVIPPFKNDNEVKGFNSMLANLNISEEPIKIMRQLCAETGKKKYTRCFEKFWKYYMKNRHVYQNSRLAFDDFASKLLNGSLYKTKPQMSKAGVNNYAKAYNFYVKNRPEDQLEKVELLRVNDVKEPKILTEKEVTEENLLKLRTEYDDTETLDAWNFSYYLGLRASEIAAITSKDFTFLTYGKNDQPYLEISVYGKGRKRSVVKSFDPYFINYVKSRLPKFPKYWFFKQYDDALETPHLTTKIRDNCQNIKSTTLTRAVKNANIKIFGVNASIHDGRRTFASLLAEQNATPETMQAQMRHTNIATTHRYVSEATKSKKIMNDLSSLANATSYEHQNRFEPIINNASPAGLKSFELVPIPKRKSKSKNNRHTKL